MKKLIAIMFCTISFLSGCASNQVNNEMGAYTASTHEERDAKKLPFKVWLTSEFTQEIVQQIQSNPRIQSNPFLIVGMNDQEVSSEINELSHYVRRELSNQLLNHRGIQIIWNPTQKKWQHHRSLTELTCHKANTPKILLGLDIQKSPFESNSLDISLRALDLEENNWISGFGKSWKTTAESNYMQGLENIKIDESLKGLRPLPFEENEIDLLASYLATNTSCLFKDSYSDEPVIIYIEKEGIKQSPVLSKVFDMVDNYLNQLREVRITDDKRQATVLLKQEIHAIDGQLHQLWVKTNRIKDGIRLSGVDTNAYMNLQSKQFLITTSDTHTQLGRVKLVNEHQGLTAYFGLQGGRSFASRVRTNGQDGKWVIQLPSNMGGTIVLDQNALSERSSVTVIWKRQQGQKVLKLSRLW